MGVRKPRVVTKGSQLWSSGLGLSFWVTPAGIAAFLGAASVTKQLRLAGWGTGRPHSCPQQHEISLSHRTLEDSGRALLCDPQKVLGPQG